MLSWLGARTHHARSDQMIAFVQKPKKSYIVSPHFLTRVCEAGISIAETFREARMAIPGAVHLGWEGDARAASVAPAMMTDLYAGIDAELDEFYQLQAAQATRSERENFANPSLVCSFFIALQQYWEESWVPPHLILGVQLLEAWGSSSA